MPIGFELIDMNIAKTAIIFPNVELGPGVVIEDFCIIGCPARGEDSKSPAKTIIGANSIIRSGTTIYSGNTIGENFQTGNKVNIRESNKFGNNVSIGTLSVIEHHVEIGDDVRIHTQVFVPEFSVLHKSCWIGPNVVLTNAKFPKSPSVKDSLQGPVLSEGCIIGANSTILPGVNIGKDAIVGAGSVVTKDITPKDVVLGNPARVVNNKDNLPYEN